MPSIANAEVFSEVTGHDVVTLSFNGEDVAAGGGAVHASLAGQPFTCSVFSSAAPNFTCALTVDAAVPGGGQLVSLLVSDGADNQTALSLPVTIDRLPPEILVDQVGVTPAVARPGQPVSITVPVSEAVRVGAELIVTGGGDDGTLVATGTAETALLSFVFVPGSVAGPRTLSLSPVADRAGNASGAAPIEVGSVEVDGDAPSVGIFTVSAVRLSAEPGANLLTVDAAIEGAAVDVDVTLVPSADAVGDEVPLVCVTTGTDPVSASCTWEVPPLGAGDPREGTEAAWTVKLEAADAVGNLEVATREIVLDFRPPSIVAPSIAVSFLPAAGNPLSSVAAATEGTEARVSFALDEVGAAVPAVTVSGFGAALDLELVSRVNLNFVYRFVVPTVGPGRDELLVVDVTARDAVDNEATLQISPPSLRLDTTPPAAIVLGAPDTVMHRRQPWGTAASGNAPGVVAAFGDVTFAPGTVPADAAVVLVEDASGNELGRGQGGDPPAPIALAGDAPVIFVVPVDDAGNRGAPVRVRDVQWTATLGGKGDGLTQNPQRFFEAPVFDAAGEAANRFVPDDVFEAGAPGGQPLVARSEPGRWQQPAVGVPSRFTPRPESGWRTTPGEVWSSSSRRSVLPGPKRCTSSTVASGPCIRSVPVRDGMWPSAWPTIRS